VLAELLDMLGYPESEGQLESRLARLREVEGANVLVAEVDGEVAGVVASCLTHLLHHERPSCRVTALAVKVGSRRTGVGRALIESVEREARLQGCSRLEVTTRPDRIEADVFYESVGFEKRPHRLVKFLEAQPTS